MSFIRSVDEERKKERGETATWKKEKPHLELTTDVLLSLSLPVKTNYLEEETRKKYFCASPSVQILLPNLFYLFRE